MTQPTGTKLTIAKMKRAAAILRTMEREKHQRLMEMPALIEAELVRITGKSRN